MIRFTGHQLDAVVVLTVDQDEIVHRLLQRAQVEGRADDTEDVIRRRQEVYAEQTEPLIEIYRERGILVEIDGMGEVARGHPADLRRPGRHPGELTGPHGLRTAASRSRRPSRSPRCAGPAWWSVGPSSCCAPPSAPGVTTAELDAIAEDAHPRRRARRRPSWATTASRPRSAPRSTTRSCTASPATGCCAEGDLDLDRLRRDRRRLARRRRDHRRRSARSRPSVTELMRVTEAGHVARHRRGPPRRPGQRHLRGGRAARARARAATASSRTTPATASARRCTSRPTCRTSAAPGAGPKLVEGLALAVEPMVTLGTQETDRPRRRLDGRHRRRRLGRALRAHLHADRRRARGCSPRSTAARRSLGRARACPFGGGRLTRVTGWTPQGGVFLRRGFVSTSGLAPDPWAARSDRAVGETSGGLSSPRCRSSPVEVSTLGWAITIGATVRCCCSTSSSSAVTPTSRRSASARSR